MTKRNVTAAILADGVGSIKDMKAAMETAPPVAKPVAFMDLDSEQPTDHSAKLLSLTGLALDRAQDILLVSPDKSSEAYGIELRAQTSTIKTVLATQLRVDENHLRRRATDALPKLLEAVAAEEKRLAARGSVDAR